MRTRSSLPEVQARVKPFTRGRGGAGRAAVPLAPVAALSAGTNDSALGAPRLAYRVLCGATFPATGSPNPCAQRLAFAVRAQDAGEALSVESAVRRAAGLPAPGEGDWLLVAVGGHFCLETDGTYRLVTQTPRRTRFGPYRPVERRPLPATLRAALSQQGLDPHTRVPRGIHGHSPVPPAVLRCPRCGRPNRVEPPAP